MALKSLSDNNSENNSNLNFCTKEEFEHIIKEGFEIGRLNCYANLTGEICYRKYDKCSLNWPIHIYITENGIAVDNDYDCGGNSSNYVWLFENYTFEEAYNLMVEKVEFYKK